MFQALQIAQIAFSGLLVACILLQNRGASAGGSFGGSDVIYGSRRGPEKILHWLTIGTAILFVISALSALFLR